MRKFDQLVDRPLRWSQPHALRYEYELHDGDALEATLVFRSIWGSFATAQTGDGTWTFKRLGFLKTRATVRAPHSDDDLGVFHNSTWRGGGTLETRDGRRFPANNNFWMTKFEFRTQSEEVLVRFESIGGIVHSSASMVILPSALVERVPPWMPVFGWYLRVMMGHDGAAAAAAAG